MPGVVGPQEDTGWFATNLQHLSDMVLVISADTTIVWGNEAIEHTMGWRHDEFVGRSFAEFLHPDDLERASEVAALVGQEVFVEDSVRPAPHHGLSEFDSSSHRCVARSVKGSGGSPCAARRGAEPPWRRRHDRRPAPEDRRSPSGRP